MLQRLRFTYVTNGAFINSFTYLLTEQDSVKCISRFTSSDLISTDLISSVVSAL